LTNQTAIRDYRPIEIDKYCNYFQIVIEKSDFWGITDAAPGMVFGSKKGKRC
jgi:hypothetical protein